MKKLLLLILLSGLLVSDLSRADDSLSINPYIAIIETPSGVGTGFVTCCTDGSVWLYTNEHVIRGGLPIKAKLLSGEKLTLGELQIVQDRDAARFRLSNRSDGIKVVAEQPGIGDEVKIFGNSDGAGVGTAIFGKILGVGPSEIEVSAAFVPGNSGSPIIVQGKGVVAIATYLKNADKTGDWTKAGTRFSQIRRFGSRIDNAIWTTIDAKTYFNSAAEMRNARTFCTLMEELCFAKSMFADVGDRPDRIRSIQSPTMYYLLKEIVKADANYSACYDKMERAKDGWNKIGFNSPAILNEKTKKEYGKKFEKEYMRAKLDADLRRKDVLSARAKALKDVSMYLQRYKTKIDCHGNLARMYSDDLKYMYNDFIKDFAKILYKFKQM